MSFSLLLLLIRGLFCEGRAEGGRERQNERINKPSFVPSPAASANEVLCLF